MPRPFTDSVILIWVAGALNQCSCLLYYSLKYTITCYILFRIYGILQQKEIHLLHFHLTFGNKILYWYHLMSKTQYILFPLLSFHL